MDFTKQNETTHETFVGENKDYRYNAEVVKENGAARSVTTTVVKKLENGEQHAGYLSLNNGNKSTNFPENESVTVHIAVFEDFLTFIRGE